MKGVKIGATIFIAVLLIIRVAYRIYKFNKSEEECIEEFMERSEAISEYYKEAPVATGPDAAVIDDSSPKITLINTIPCAAGQAPLTNKYWCQMAGATFEEKKFYALIFAPNTAQDNDATIEADYILFTPKQYKNLKNNITKNRSIDTTISNYLHGTFEIFEEYKDDYGDMLSNAVAVKLSILSSGYDDEAAKGPLRRYTIKTTTTKNRPYIQVSWTDRGNDEGCSAFEMPVTQFEKMLVW